MDRIDTIATDIVRREGGFVNDPDDPDDPGGATKYGVIIHTMRRLGLDLTGDGQANAHDVRYLSVAQAVDILKKLFLQTKDRSIANSITGQCI